MMAAYIAQCFGQSTSGPAYLPKSKDEKLRPFAYHKKRKMPHLPVSVDKRFVMVSFEN